MADMLAGRLHVADRRFTLGAAPVVAGDPLPAARERALALGADAVLTPATPRPETACEG